MSDEHARGCAIELGFNACTCTRCGHTVVDNEGIEQPCDRPATGWRWYQDVEHEDCLEPACDWHANEGGRRMREAENGFRNYKAMWRDNLEYAVAIEKKLARVEALVENPECSYDLGGVVTVEALLDALADPEGEL